MKKKKEPEKKQKQPVTKTISGLFYCPNGKVLFFIPDYYTNGSCILKTLYKNLKEGENMLRQFQPKGDIYASEILSSRRYKGMWSFHITLDKCPKEAYCMGDDWTMSKWISS